MGSLARFELGAGVTRGGSFRVRFPPCSSSACEPPFDTPSCGALSTAVRTKVPLGVHSSRFRVPPRTRLFKYTTRGSCVFFACFEKSARVYFRAFSGGDSKVTTPSKCPMNTQDISHISEGGTSMLGCTDNTHPSTRNTLA